MLKLLLIIQMHKQQSEYQSQYIEQSPSSKQYESQRQSFRHSYDHDIISQRKPSRKSQHHFYAYHYEAAQQSNVRQTCPNFSHVELPHQNDINFNEGDAVKYNNSTNFSAESKERKQNLRKLHSADNLSWNGSSLSAKNHKQMKRSGKAGQSRGKVSHLSKYSNRKTNQNKSIGKINKNKETNIIESINVYKNIADLTTQQNQNLRDQNKYLIEKLKKMKQKQIKIQKIFQSAKRYKALYLETMQQIESAQDECQIYEKQAQQLKILVLNDIAKFKHKMNHNIGIRIQEQNFEEEQQYKREQQDNEGEAQISLKKSNKNSGTVNKFDDNSTNEPDRGNLINRVNQPSIHKFVSQDESLNTKTSIIYQLDGQEANLTQKKRQGKQNTNQRNSWSNNEQSDDFGDREQNSELYSFFGKG